MPTTAPGAPRRSSPLRVLVIDDNMDGAQALGAVLTSMGCTTAVAFNGAQGLDNAETFAPDLALIDLEMPDMNGCELASRLREGPAGCSARLVCLTGRGQPEDRYLCAVAGFDDFFTKPMRMEDLAALVAATKSSRPEG